MLQANVKMMEWGDEPEEDAFLRYLEGIIYESLGELDSALISYRKAYTVYKEKGGSHVKTPPKSAPQVGFEPTTYRLTADCSAVELLRTAIASRLYQRRKGCQPFFGTYGHLGYHSRQR